MEKRNWAEIPGRGKRERGRGRGRGREREGGRGREREPLHSTPIHSRYFPLAVSAFRVPLAHVLVIMYVISIAAAAT